MDAYEATKIVFSRIQAMDPDNAAKIMGLLLIQDHGEKEMIRLAFGPEALVQSVVLKARKDLGLLPPTPSTPSSPSPFSRQNSTSSRLGTGSGLPSPSSWGAPPVFSRSNSCVNGNGASLLSNGVVDDLSADDLMGGGAANNGANLGGGSASPAPFYGNGDLMDDFQLQDQLSFLNDPSVGMGAGTGSSPNSSLHGLMGVNHNANAADLFYSDLSSECRSPSSNGNAGDILFPYTAWGMSNGHHRSRSCSMADLYLNSDAAAAAGFGGWKPCLYYARGYCKNGSSCRFQHGLADDSSAAAVAAAIAGGKMDAVVEQQCQELLLRSKSQQQQQQQRIGASQLMASAAPFPYASSPTSAGKCMNFLLQQQQQQQSENQRAAAAAAAAAALMLGGGGDDMQQHKFFGGRSRLMADYAAGMANPGSRQIYLTFPADSTFREEDVSNYFSIYGPVQDVRIPYQQKRMFGFVTFVYPETVKIILAKGNPHFVCDARVLVKPYKEKGKIPDKKHQQQQLDRGDFSGCTTPTGLDSRDPYDLGSRMLFNVNQEALIRRKLEEQQAVELQQAIELQSRRFMGLNLLDLKNTNTTRSISLPVTCPSPINTGPPTPIPTSVAPPPAAPTVITTRPPSQDGSPTGATATTEDKCPSPNATTELAQQGAVNPIAAPTAASSVTAAAATAAADKEESAPAVAAATAAAAAAAAAAGKGSPDGDGDFQESAEHNLPDSPFASPTKSSFTGAMEAFSEASAPDAVNSPARHINGANHIIGSSASIFSPTLDLRSYKSCFLQIPRFSSGHGAVGL